MITSQTYDRLREVQYQITQTRLRIAETKDLLQQNFNPFGTTEPDYLTKLFEQLENQRNSLNKELITLQKNISRWN